MWIDSFTLGPFQTNTLVIADDQGEAILIDPSFGAYEVVEPYLKKNNYHLNAIYLTHSHQDHIADVSQFKKVYAIPVYVHQLDQDNLIKPGSDRLPLVEVIEGVQPDGFLEDNQDIQVGELHFKVLHTPGHSPGSVCFYFQEEKTLVSGDTLFKGTYGNLSFPGGSPLQMGSSLKRLSQLEKDTEVWPGHGETTFLEYEKWLNDIKITQS